MCAILGRAGNTKHERWWGELEWSDGGEDVMKRLSMAFVGASFTLDSSVG